MKRPHLLRVDRDAAAFVPLIAACREAGLRVGWLEVGAAAIAAPADLEAAAGAGALRAVAAAPGRTLAVKALRGAPVVADLLREHFLGCRLVLVRGEGEAPFLEPDGGRWLLRESAAEPPRRLTTGELMSVLRQPPPAALPRR